MEPYQEESSCHECWTRVILRGQRDRHAEGVARYEVKCPVCGMSVVFSIRGVLGPDPARLICYERARRREGLPLR
jgi:hypothetical protein